MIAPKLEFQMDETKRGLNHKTLGGAIDGKGPNIFWEWSGGGKFGFQRLLRHTTIIWDNVS